jgi:glycosyltransferase involved in cell wall biosynthesis
MAVHGGHGSWTGGAMTEARRGRVAVVYDEFPGSIRYPEARPALLLAERGHDVHVVSLDTRPVDTAPARWWPASNRLALVRRVAALRPKLVFVESTTANLVAVPFGSRSWVRAPLPSPNPLKAAVQKALLSRADAVSFCHPAQGDPWRVPPERLADLPYPVDVSFWSQPVTREAEWWHRRGAEPPGGPVVALVANLLRRKRQVEALTALEPVLARRADVTLVFAGATFEAEVEAELRARIRERGLTGRVRLLGGLPRDDVRQLLAWTSVHVVNTAFETQCMAVYESLAAGVPTLIAGIPELTSAFPELPAHRDAADLSRNVEAVLDDPELARRAVERSQARVRWADIEHHDELFEAGCERLGI